MTLRRKTLAIVGLTLLGVLVILVGISESLILGGFYEIEQNQAKKNLDRAVLALNGSLEEIRARAADWAIWDDTYDFIANGNPEYIKSNIVDSTFTGVKTNAILLIDSAGKVMCGQGYDLIKQKLEPVSQDLLKHFSPKSILLDHQDTKSVRAGIVMLPKGPMLVVSHPILTGEGKGPIRGSLVFGRELDDREIKRLEELTRLSIRLHRLEGKITDELRKKTESLKWDDRRALRVQDENTITGFYRENDIYGQPCLLIQVDMKRDIYRHGKTSVVYLVFSIIGSGMVFGLVVILLLEKGILTRLSRLGTEVNGIRSMSDLSARVSEDGHDELTRLAADINNMLEKLEWSQLGMQEALKRFEAIIENSPNVAIQGIDRQGVIRHWNNACRDIYGYEASEAIGKRVQDILLPNEDVAEFERIVDEIWTGNKLGPIQEWEIVNRQGETRWVYASMFPVAVQGKVVEIFCMDVDITERKKMESQLEASKKVVSTLVENLPGMAFRCLNDKNRSMEYVSEGSLDLTGYTFAELEYNKKVAYTDIIHPDDRENVWEEIQTAIDDRRNYQVIYRITTATGEEKWVREQGRGTYDSDGRVRSIEGFINDITDSKLAEEVIMTTEANYRAIFDAVNDAILIHDIETGNIIDMNRKACEMYGYQINEIRGCSIEIINSNEPGYSLDDLFRKIHSAAKGKAQLFEWRYRRRSGDAFWSEVNLKRAIIGGQDHLLAVVRDISERKRAEEELKRINLDLAQREESLRKANVFQQKLLSTAATAIFTVDKEMRITSVNDSFTAIAGFNAEEILGKPCSILEGFPCKERCGLYDPNRKDPIVKKQCMLTTKDGRKLTILKSADLIRDDDGQVVGGIESFVDVTELVQAREAAESASKTKSIFLANMSHEIRTPMNGIIGMTELALNTNLSGEQREYLDMVKQSADSLLCILNDILDFSKIEAGKLDLTPTGFNLHEIVGDTVGSLAIRAEAKNLELICRVWPNVPNHLIGDPGRLRQIIVNLVGNAVKFTEQGEIVTEVRVQSQTDDDVFLQFSVRDTGIGIAKEKQTIIFDAFTQVDGSSSRKYDGTGLGLAISAQLVKMMGGKIWVESEPGKGSTFYFTARFERQKAPTHLSVETGIERLHGVPVLIVDDNQTNRVVLGENLERWEMKPHLAGSGSAGLLALKEAREAGSPIQLILLDCNMPEMDGFEFVEQMKRNHLDGAAVVLLTPAGKRGDGPPREELGISGYLVKPVKPSEILQVVMKALKIVQENSDGSKSDLRYSLSETRRPLKILLAEDNPINQKLTIRLLEKAGHSVVLASNGLQAVEHYEKEKFDLILMDVQMPEMGGFEATGIIREKEKSAGTHIPIIAMTAHAMKGDKEKCLEAGMDGYVTKPVQLDAFFQAIDEVMALPLSNPNQKS